MRIRGKEENKNRGRGKAGKIYIDFFFFLFFFLQLSTECIKSSAERKRHLRLQHKMIEEIGKGGKNENLFDQRRRRHRCYSRWNGQSYGTELRGIPVTHTSCKMTSAATALRSEFLIPSLTHSLTDTHMGPQLVSMNINHAVAPKKKEEIRNSAHVFHVLG